jgi:hypothetical protein
VYGRKTQTFRKIIRVRAEEGENNLDVLGCFVCGVKVIGSSIDEDTAKSKKIKAKVKCDTHIWYRTENDTTVAKISTEFSDHIEVAKQGSEAFRHEKAGVWIKEEPKCLEPIIIGNPDGNQIAVEIEYVLEAEIIGEAVLSVKVFDT